MTRMRALLCAALFAGCVGMGQTQEPTSRELLQRMQCVHAATVQTVGLEPQAEALALFALNAFYAHFGDRVSPDTPASKDAQRAAALAILAAAEAGVDLNDCP